MVDYHLLWTEAGGQARPPDGCPLFYANGRRGIVMLGTEADREKLDKELQSP